MFLSLGTSTNKAGPTEITQVNFEMITKIEEIRKDSKTITVEDSEVKRIGIETSVVIFVNEVAWRIDVCSRVN